MGVKWTEEQQKVISLRDRNIIRVNIFLHLIQHSPIRLIIASIHKNTI